MAEGVKKDINSVLGGVECYSDGISKLAGELRGAIVVDADGKVVLDFRTGVALAQLVWDSVKRNVKTCAGKEIQVSLPTGLVGIVLSYTLNFFGFKL